MTDTATSRRGGQRADDTRMGHITARPTVTEDGTEWDFRCPCGWTATGRTQARGLTHARSCPWAYGRQERLV